MAISFVGSVTGTEIGSSATITLDLTALTGGSGSAAIEGDFVLVVSGWAGTADGNPGVSTSGYTEVADIYSNDTHDANLSAAYKRMGSTPDTSVVVNTGGDEDRGDAAVAFVFRGVHATTPIDVTTTTATGIDTGLADAPSITPTTSGAVVVALMMSARGASDAFTGPSGMSGFVQATASDFFSLCTASAAYYAWTSGAYDPPALTGGTNGASDSWAAASVALRPAPDVKVYYVIGPSSGWSDPTATEIKAGQLSGGGAATASGNETSPTVTDEPFTFSSAATGLTASTNYKTATVWSDGTSNSNVSVSATAWSTTSSGTNASTTLTGVGTTSAAGTLTASGAAATTLTGATTTASAGTVTASNATNASTTLAGAGTTAAPGTLTATGAATATLTGVVTTSSAGTVSATGDAAHTLTGAGTTSNAGTVTAAAGGSATATLTGSETTSNAGTLTATGAATGSLTGATTTASAGTVLASSGTNAEATLTGAAVSASVGALAATGAAQIVVTGVQVTASAGTLTATGAGAGTNASVTLTGAGTISYAGIVSASSAFPIMSSSPLFQRAAGPSRPAQLSSGRRPTPSNGIRR